MKKNIELITAALLLGTQTLIGSDFFAFRDGALGRLWQEMRAFLGNDFFPLGGGIGAASRNPSVRDPSVDGLFVPEVEMSEDEQSLIDAIIVSDIPRVIRFLNMDILRYSDLRFREGRTLVMAIMEAAKRGFISRENACLLIGEFGRRYPDMLNDTDHNRRNALEYAIEMDLPDMVEALLHCEGVRVFLYGDNARLFVKIVIRCENLVLIQEAFKRGMEKEQVEKLLRFAQRELDQIKSSISVSNFCVGCLLPKAVPEVEKIRVCFRLIAMLSRWIQREADTKNERELIEAIVMLNIEEVRRLLAVRGLNINYQDQRGYTPLMWAAAMGDLDIVCAVLRRNPDLDVRNGNRGTVFDVAQGNRNKDIINALDQARRGRRTR
ncbi:MAG: ankyrin repeat domain-containing protein [Puniceicoccales bacterium]|jgi:hypothetical protein|nr:ankyrin repeat domain-containing protein [Puniceicoccales bacterium]